VKSDGVGVDGGGEGAAVRGEGTKLSISGIANIAEHDKTARHAGCTRSKRPRPSHETATGTLWKMNNDGENLPLLGSEVSVPWVHAW
jgi:hypothetical protein